jgi:hypothetical protein
MDTTNGARSGEAGERTDLPRIVVRNSRDTDVPGMLAIYLHHIRRGVDPGIDGEFEAPDAEDLKRRRRSMNNRKMPHRGGLSPDDRLYRRRQRRFDQAA